MLRCPSCSDAIAETSRFCPACGTAVDVSSTPTSTAARPSPRPPTPVRQTPGSGAGSSARVPTPARTEARFAPGALLADRYRVVGLIGRGGMGEVYRADDLKLDQPVALKFMPQALQDDPERRERFYNEVRMARQISHAAVCRVHDVGEVVGQPFLSMEYVDGEDLASLLRRIGRLPSQKALDIARQVCAGLAAAHAQGVLHRDLKPENVMLDGRGRVRITDFGLAGVAEGISGQDVRSGTPAYMSPEQLAGREVTPRSDLYSLGLLLYELFTGRRAFEGRSYAELERKHREEPPPRPSTVVEDLDPAVERAILRCLEKHPHDRPRTALAVAAALPGGDPLVAALAAGETPAPEVVAAARSEGLPRPAAWALATVTVGAALLMPILARPLQLFGLVPFEKPPAALEDRAHELLQRLGYAQPPADAARGFTIDADYLRYVGERDRSPRRWEVLSRGQPPAVVFWYRQGPRFLLTTSALGHVYSANPPLLESGMAGASFDLRGRLVKFYAVPPQRDPLPPEGRDRVAPDWSMLFAEARLEPQRFRPAAPVWAPPFYADARAAWEGVFPDNPEIPIRVEAAGYRGRPVWFEIVAPWTRPERMQSFGFTTRQRAAAVAATVLLLLLLVASGWLAHRQVARARGDQAGALRLALYAAVVGLLGWVLWADHVADLAGELTLMARAVGLILLIALIVWVLYLALEPYVRRRSPHLLISWTRLLGGRWDDPAVGRDVLFGTAAGVFMAVVVTLVWRLSAWLGLPAPRPIGHGLDLLLGVKGSLSAALYTQLDAAAASLGVLVMFVLLRMVLRSDAAALAGVLMVIGFPNALSADMPFVAALPFAILDIAVPVFVMLRFGLLAAILGLYVGNRLLSAPLTLRLDHWTGGPTVFVLVLVAALVAWGLWASASRRRLAVVHEMAA